MPAQHLSYTARASRDVNEHATHISAWRQEYDQLSRGAFEGLVRELWIDAPRLQIFHEHTGRRTSQQCVPWAGSVWFGVPDAPGAEPVHFAGRAQPIDTERVVMSARAEDGFVLRTPENFGIYGVVVDEHWLAGEFDRLGLRPAARHRTALLAPHRHVALCQTIESMLSIGAHIESDASWRRAMLRGLLDRLLGLLGGHAGEEPARRAAAASPLQQRRLEAVLAARSLVASPLNHAMTIDDLCEELHLTPRTLLNHFRSVVGESPVEFLRAVRLNACRRKLRAAEAVTVQDVAALWGFFHMGRFSSEYRAMFGELPSVTLRAGNGCV